MRTCVPDACPTTQSLLAAAQLPPRDYLADSLVGELAALATELILVLDDYHVIRASEVHEFMRQLLRYLPPSLHLVILTRKDPPLSLGRLRVEGQITELRAADLRFALTETRSFLQRRVDQPLDDEALQVLHARTDGWVIGLQFASTALQRQEMHQFLAHFHGSDRLLVGYLVEEVMAQLPEPVQTFLLRTAIVDRFCASLGDALLADSPLAGSSQATIAVLEEQNLFVIPLDQEGDWFRYHDLFRDFLRHRLKSEETQESIAHLHRRASAWLARAGLIEEALRHALAAGDERGAADLVEAQLHPLLNRQFPIYTLARWLDLFPEQALQAHPGLLIAQAVLGAFGASPAGSPALLVRVETLLQADTMVSEERRQSLQATLAALRGIGSYSQGELEQAILQLQAALVDLPPMPSLPAPTRPCISPWPMPAVANQRQAAPCCIRRWRRPPRTNAPR